MYLLLFKTLHIIGFVAWIGGIFYLVRVFMHHSKTFSNAEPEKSVMLNHYEGIEQKLYRVISNPAMMITWICGIGIIYFHGLDWLRTQPWLHIKLTLVFLFTIFHVYCKKNIVSLAKNKKPLKPFTSRVFNEIPFLFLVTIVFLAVYENNTNFMYLFGSVFVLGLLIYFTSKSSKK